MSNAGKKTTVKDGFVAPQIKLEEEQKGAAVSVKQQIDCNGKPKLRKATIRPSRTISTRKRKRCLRRKMPRRPSSHPSSIAVTC
jgi:hypothetical protein